MASQAQKIHDKIQAQCYAILEGALVTLTKTHDGDCRVYPAVANGHPWKEEDCDCYNKIAREALRRTGRSVEGGGE